LLHHPGKLKAFQQAQNLNQPWRLLRQPPFLFQSCTLHSLIRMDTHQSPKTSLWLSVQDFEQYSVWEYALDEERADGQ
jgi:hypothetical protein